MKITIRDVARAAGVSVTSVSRHLNGQINLPEPTASRIRQAAERLGYRPNAIARRLSSGKSETLGLIIAYPLFAEIASASEAEAARHGYNLLMFNSRNLVEKEVSFLSRIEDRQVDGILLLTNHHDDGRLLRRINETGNVVLLDEDVPGAKAPRLFADNVHGGLLATRHLIARGHTRIAAIGGPRGLLSTTERLDGFTQALGEVGLRADPALLRFCEYEEAPASIAFLDLLEQNEPPTAIFTFGDMLATGAMRAARQAGIRIPDDISLVSFDDIHNADLLAPALTTVRQSAAEFGTRGINMLLDFIAGRKSETVIERVGVELVIRSSVASPHGRPSGRSIAHTGAGSPDGLPVSAREEEQES
ncbi:MULTISPECIES: LacI family DNA-binding transcriptional regulator [Mesorhizobium]|uniref:LacI family DNA-binding transcriptional regulator n=1 Tax=Mesorhizobium TaxID=68287 RepID=UPI001FEF9BF0|nr:MULTISPECIES: LacI family DNA-binding transcriptional regulator [Mesorhizobium]